MSEGNNNPTIVPPGGSNTRIQNGTALQPSVYDRPGRGTGPSGINDRAYPVSPPMLDHRWIGPNYHAPRGPTDSTRPLKPTETIRPTRPSESIRPTRPSESIRPVKPSETLPQKPGFKPSVGVGITRDQNGNLSLGGSIGTSFGPVSISYGTKGNIGISGKIPLTAPGLSAIIGVGIGPEGSVDSVTGGVNFAKLIDLTITTTSQCEVVLGFSFKTPLGISFGFSQKYVIEGCEPIRPPYPPARTNGGINPIDFDPGFPGLSPEEEDWIIRTCRLNPGCGVTVELVRYWTTYTYESLDVSWQESREIVDRIGRENGWLQRTFPGQGGGHVRVDGFEGSVRFDPPSQYFPKGYLSLGVGSGGWVDMRAWMAERAEYRGIDYSFSYAAKDYAYYYAGIPPYGYAHNYPDKSTNPYRVKGLKLNCNGVESRIPYPGYSEDRIWNPPFRDLPPHPPTRRDNLNRGDDMSDCECACASLRLLREIHEVLNPAQIKAFVAPVCPDPLDPEAPPVEPEVPPEPFVIADYPSLFTYLLMQFCNIGDSNVAKALGFPFTMHKYLNADREGEEEIKNLADLYKNWIEIFDAIVGEFPVKMEITTDENQTAPLEFTTIADALADIGALNVATAYDADNTFTLLIKVMLQVLKTNSLSHQTYDLIHLTNEQLGFRIKQKPFKQKLPIDPRFPDDWVKFNQDWEPEEDNCISFENDDKDTAKGILILMQEAVALIKSAHTMSGTPDQIVNRIKGLAQIVQLGRQLGLGETLADILSGNWQSTLESFQKPATSVSPEIKVSDSEAQAPVTP